MIRSNASTTTATRLQGPWLTLARLVWIAATLTVAILTVAAIPQRFNEVRVTGTVAEQLSPADAEALQPIGLTVEGYGVLYITMAVAFALTSFTLGVLIFQQRSDDLMAILFSLAFITYGPTNFYLLRSLVAIVPATRLPVDLATGASYGILGVLVYTFPDGRVYPRLVRPLIVVWVGWMLIWPFFPGTILDLQTWSALPFFLILVGWFGVGIVSAFLRYRRRLSATQRQQFKWLLYGYAVAIVGYSADELPRLLFPALVTPGLPHALYLLIGNFIFATSIVAMLLTVCVAILRYRLFEIDRLINRSLVYGVLSVGLGMVFVATVLLLQRLFLSVSGNQGAPLAIASAAVVIGTLFQPTRRRLQAAVDRRFFRFSVDVSRFDTASRPAPIFLTTNLTGTQFGAYRVEEPLGRGGMADVYKGRHVTLNRTVALKILSAEQAQQTDFRTRFEREARMVAGLRHPNIVQVFDFGSVDGTYYMAMEFIDGQDMAQFIRRQAPLPLSEALPLLRDVGGALDYAHQQGIVHRDVKPSNVMLQPTSPLQPTDNTCRAILTDFGIAKIVSGATGLTGTGTMGTLDYIAPEQILNSSAVDAGADIYALGVISYQLLTGQLPFAGTNPAAIIFGHLQAPVPDPRQHVPTIPGRAVNAITRAMAKEPRKRFAAAGEFVAALS